MPRQFENIPGLNTEYRDHQLITANTEPETGNIGIADFALWGPVNDAVRTRTTEPGLRIFGKTTGAYGDATRNSGYNGNALSQAFVEVMQGGCRDVTLTRLDFGAETAYSIILIPTEGDLASTTEEANMDDAATPSIESITLTLTDTITDATDIRVGQAAWFSVVGGDTDDTIYTVAEIDVENNAVILDANEAYVEPGEGEERTWNFAVGLKVAGAYPGKLGNSIGFKVTTSGSIKTLTIKSPEEFGNFVNAYSSNVYTDFGKLIYRANIDLADIVELEAVYGLETNDVTTLLTTLIDAEDDNDYLYVGAAAAQTEYHAGTDFGYDTALAAWKNPSTQSSYTAIGRQRKRKWYAEALGNVNDPLDDEKGLPLLRGQTVGVLIVPSLNLDDLVSISGGNILPFDDDDAGSSSEPIYKNALQYLLDFAHQQNVDGITTEVAIGVSPLRNPTAARIKSRVDFLKLLGQSGGPLDGQLKTTDGNSPEVDAGMYLSVIAGPSAIVSNPATGAYFSNGAAQYAVLLTTLSPANSPTLKPVPGVLGLSYEFGPRAINTLAGGQGNALSGGAYVVFTSTGAGALVNLAVTATNRDSDYKMKQNIRTVQAAVAATRRGIAPFLGMPFGLTQRQGMNTKIESELNSLVDFGVFNGGRGEGYDFSITRSPSQAVLNEASVTLWVKPNYELDWVRVVVSMRS